jgi:hypothetical protein
MSKNMFDLESGVWKGEKNKTADETYCRSWTTLDRYDSISKLIRNKPLYNDKLAPYRFRTKGSVLDGPFVKIGPYSDDSPDDPKKFMFSIENLAWKDNLLALAPCEIGPGDLVSGEKGRIMWFPPYDIQFSENNSVNWEETNFIGRGEPIYTYNNTKRTGQLSFKIIVDHPSYFNAFNARKNASGSPDDNYIASFFAGCVDIDKRWSDKLTKTQLEEIKPRIIEKPQIKQEPKNPPTPDTMSVYYPNDVKIYNPEYEDAKCGDGSNIDYEQNPNGFLCGLFLIKADVTQKDVNGKTVEWPDRFDYGLNSGRNSTADFPTFVINKENAAFGFNDSAYGDDMVTFLKEYPWAVVNFKGFASPQGNPNSNTKLAEERAKLLREKLIEEWGGQLGVSKDVLEKRFKLLDAVALKESDTPGCIVESSENPNPPVDFDACKIARRVEISVTFDSTLKAEKEKSLLPFDKPPFNTGENVRIRKEITNKFYSECDYFERMVSDYEDENGDVIPGNKFVFDSIREKIRYFHPAFHSTTPEGLNSRLTFLLQCTRQGPTLEKQGANNLAFGRPPICILRIGDFYNTKIAIDSVNISYEPLVWDLNPEGIGVQPMIANVDMSFSFLGGSSLMGPINKLQNALSFNYFANTHVYDPRADYISKDMYATVTVKDGVETSEFGYHIADGNLNYLDNIEEKIISEEILASEALSIDQISEEEFVNFGIDNITDEPPSTGSTYIIITNMTCDQANIVKTDSNWLLPIKLTYLPELEGGAEEAVEKLESGYGNYKIKVKDVNSNEMYENFMTKDKFVKFFTLNDFSDDSKFVVPIKGEGISDAEQGIKDNLLKENFYVSLIKDGNELYKINIKL